MLLRSIQHVCACSGAMPTGWAILKALPFTIQDDQQRAMKDIYKTLSIDEKFLPLKASLSAIGRMKDKMISPRDAIAEAKDVRSTSLARVYEAYQKKLFFGGRKGF